MITNTAKTGRRTFLMQACAGAAAAAAGPVARAGDPSQKLPVIRLGSHEITRLISGGNPIGGWAHSTQNMARHMLEYFTPERTVEYVEKIARAGINTWQCDHIPKVIRALRTVRERGVTLNFICLHAEREKEASLKMVMADLNPIAIVHHGGVTDRLFREGKMQQVHDFVKKVHDQGVLAGVSSHSPANIQRIADQGWENDLFMTCFYYVNRPREEQQALLGKITVDEPFFESDPVEMTKAVRQISKPCLGFKILAAGRLCANQRTVERAFKFAFENIKPIDAVIVGMYPRFEDEITCNVSYTSKYGSPT